MELPQSLESIVDGIFYPGEITLIGGAPSIGKTRFALHFLHGLSTGSSGWWGSYAPMRTLYCSQRSLLVTAAQMRTVGLNAIPDNMTLFCPADLNKLEKSKFNLNPIQYLNTTLLNTPDKPKVIILDTLINYLPPTINGRSINFNSYMDIVKACDEVYYWAQNHGFAVAPLHHTAKQKTDSKHSEATERILGSQAIMASVISSCILEHTIPNDPTFIKINLMSRLAQLPAAKYFRGSDFTEVTELEATTQITQTELPKLGAAEEKVLAQLTLNYINCSDIALLCKDKFGMQPNQVYNVIKNLKTKKYACLEETTEGQYKIRKMIN